MWDIRACLACLSTRNRLEKISEPHRKLYLSLMGIKMSDIDGYPVYFCYICQAQIRKVLAFKRRCRRAYYVMKEIISVRKMLTQNDIMQVNRRKTNLVSSICNWKSLNTAVYSVEPVPTVLNSFVDSLDQYDPKDKKPDLVKKDLCTMGGSWHIDIMSSVKIEPDPEPSPGLEICLLNPVLSPQAPVIETANIPSEDMVKDVKEPLEEINEVLDDVKTEFPEEVVSDDDGFDDFEFEEPPKKKKHNPEKVEFQSKILKLPVNEVAEALSDAKIRYLSKLEQIAMYNEGKSAYPYRTALFKCALCLIVFNDLDSLMKHTDKHNKLCNSKFLCDICKTKVSDELDLQIHVAEKHAYQYTCTLCKNASFNIIDEYIQHHKSYHMEQSKANQNNILGRMEYVRQYFSVHPVPHEDMYAKLTNPACKHLCTECGMRFHENIPFAHHKAAHHTNMDNKYPVKCDICGVYCTNTKTMSNHMERWHLYTYKCKECNETAFNRVEALYHKRTTHPRRSRYICELCGKQYYNRANLSKHNELKHYSTTHLYHCAVCGNSFHSLVDLYRHQLTTYKYIRIPDPVLIEDGHTCDQCNVTFLSLRSFQTHAIKHKHEVVKTFENVCFTCKNIFDTAEEYEEHKRTTCTSLAKYPRKCPFCDLVMGCYKSYRAHHRSKHALMPLQKVTGYILCELCGMAVRDKELHAKQHAEEVPLECAHCTPTLRLPNMWKYCVHMLTVHTPKPYICNLCSHSFETRKLCKWHILKDHLHSSPYRCDTCQEIFFNIHVLLKHCKTYGHTTQRRKEISTLKMLYVYPHMRINVSMFHPKLLSKIRMYLCDFPKSKRMLLNDINEFIYFENQDTMPPVVTERKLKTEQLNLLKEHVVEFSLSLFGPKIDIIQDSAKVSNLSSTKASKRKPRKKKLKTIEESKISVDLCEARSEMIKEENDKSLQENIKLKQEKVEGVVEEFVVDGYESSFADDKQDGWKPSQRKMPRIKFKRKLKPDEVEILEESVVENYDLSQEITVPMKYEEESMIEEEVVEETGVEYDMNEQVFDTFEENGQKYININGVLYKLADGYAFTENQR